MDSLVWRVLFRFSTNLKLKSNAFDSTQFIERAKNFSSRRLAPAGSFLYISGYQPGHQPGYESGHQPDLIAAFRTGSNKMQIARDDKGPTIGSTIELFI